MFRVVSLFAFLGPFIVGIITLYFIFIGRSNYTEEIIITVFLSPLLALFFYPASFMAVGIPAMLTGVLYGVVLKNQKIKNLNQVKRIFVGGSIGFIIYLVYSLLSVFYYLPLVFIKSEKFYFLYVCFASVGAIASSFCALLITNKYYLSFVSKT